VVREEAMTRDINIEGTIAGAPFELRVVYEHDPGQPWAWDCAPLGESVAIIELSIVSKSGQGDLTLNPDQQAAILETCEDAIYSACFEDAAEQLQADGWTFDSHYRAWIRPRMRRYA
jgi:hypothetical protein